MTPKPKQTVYIRSELFLNIDCIEYKKNKPNDYLGPAFFTKHDLAGDIRLINRYRFAINETEKFVVRF